MGRPGSGALPTPTARPLGGLPGPTTHWLWVRGGAGVGTPHQPHSARPCVLCGRHEGARGGRLLPGCGVSGVGRSPTPDCPPSGRAAGAHYPLALGAGGCGRGDPSPTPQRVLLRAGFARCGGGVRVPGGGASCLGVGRLGSGALPPPTARPLGGLPGPTTHWLWVRGGAGVGTRHQPHSASSCVLWGRHEGARGGRHLPGCGASGVGRSPTPMARPLGVPVLGRVGWAGLPGAFWCASPLLSTVLGSLCACSAPSGLGWPCLCLLLGFFGFFLFLFPFSPSLRPCCLLLCLFSGLGCPGPACLVAPPPFFFLFSFLPPPSLLSPAFPAFWLPWALAPPLPSFFFFPVRLFAALCWCPFVVLCASFVLFLVACVVASWCRCLLLRVCWWLWLPGVLVWWCVSALLPVSGLAAAGRLPCGVLFPCAVSCGAVLPCGAVLWCPVFFFFSLLTPAGGASFPLFPVGSGLRAGSGSFLFLFSACAVLCWCACVVALCSVLSCPRWVGWCCVLLPVVFVCLLLGLAVLCCLLVGPGGSWCGFSVACCGVSLGAVLRRVAARCAAWRCVVVRCVVSFCSVSCCRALCCVLGRCPLSWGPVPSGAVFCLVPPRCVCFAVVCRRVVLFAVLLCAMCALGCRVVRFLSSLPCAVLLCGPLSLGALLPCAVPRDAVLPRGAVVSCPADLLGLFLSCVWLYLLEKPLQNFVKYFFLFFRLLKIKLNYTRPNTLACSKTVYAAVLYVLPVVLDVLGLVLVRGVVERVGVHC